MGFFFYSVSKLPDPVVINQSLKNKTEQKAVKAPEFQREIGKEAEALSEEFTQQDIESKPQKSRDTTEKELMRIMNEDFSDIRVCENLSNPMTEKVTPEMMAKALSSESRSDAGIESFRPSIKHIFQSKPVKELFSEIDQAGRGLEGEDRSNYLRKIGFYAFAAKKAQEIYSKKADYEEMGDRSFHLYMIAQIANRKPELANDKHVLDFCNQLQASIGQKAKTDIAEERKELLKLIEYSGFTPQELGFNPDVRTKFNLDLNNKGISFGFTTPTIDDKVWR